MTKWVIIISMLFGGPTGPPASLDVRKELPPGTTREQCLKELESTLFLVAQNTKGSVAVSGECKQE
jgi:hypothetical protein